MSRAAWDELDKEQEQLELENEYNDSMGWNYFWGFYRDDNSLVVQDVGFKQKFVFNWVGQVMAVRHRIRKDGNGNTKVVTLTARKAIIEHCKDCFAFNATEVRRCTSKLCPMYPFRTRDVPQNTVWYVHIEVYSGLNSGNRGLSYSGTFGNEKPFF